jgi:hypothetical protein
LRGASGLINQRNNFLKGTSENKIFDFSEGMKLFEDLINNVNKALSASKL